MTYNGTTKEGQSMCFYTENQDFYARQGARGSISAPARQLDREAK